MKDSERNILTTIEVVSATALVVFLSTFAFSERQREWIRRRDKDKCQAPFKHKHKGRLEVHHILPQGYAHRMGIENYDFPENGITICQTAHDIIHPDMTSARAEYNQDVGSFGKLREQRSARLDNREIYWNDEFDRQMQVVTLRTTQEYEKKYKFPGKE